MVACGARRAVGSRRTNPQRRKLRADPLRGQHGASGAEWCAQNARFEPLLLKIFVCVTVTSPGPTQAATLLAPVV